MPAEESPSPARDADVRRRLIESAAHLLGEGGLSALTARRLAAEAGTSTMAVYTHFGGMPALVREVVAEGFTRLIERVDAVQLTEDPLADLAALAVAYRQNALDNPDLYAVMFGSASLGVLELTEKELTVSLAAFTQLVSAVERAMAAGALRRDDPDAVAGQLWTALHGYVMLELSGFIGVVENPEERVLQAMLGHLLESLAASES